MSRVLRQIQDSEFIELLVELLAKLRSRRISPRGSTKRMPMFNRVKIITALICFVVSLALPLVLSAAAQKDIKEEESFYVARKAFEDGFYDVCLNLLSRFSQNYPLSSKKPEAALLTGQCYYYQDRFLEALSKFEEVLAAPDQPRRIEDALYYWIAEVHFKGKNFTKSAEYYRKVIEQYPSSVYAAASHYSLGWCFFEERMFKEALQQFEQLIQRFPREAVARDAAFKSIECLYILREYAVLINTVREYSKGYRFEEGKAQYLNYYLAESEYYLGNYEQALKLYSAVLAGKPSVQLQALVNLGLGWTYLKLKDLPQAQGKFAAVRVEELDGPNTEVLLLGKASLYADSGRFEDAVNIYAEMAGRSSDDNLAVQAYLGKADMFYAMKRFKEAAVIYDEALRKFSASAVSTDINDKLRYGYAWSLLKEGEFKQAITAFRNIAAASNDSVVKVSALCQIADAYQDSGEYPKAFETYEKILKEYPDNVYNDYVQYQLGLVLMKSSDYEGAITIFKSARENYQSSKLLDEISYALALAYFQKESYTASSEVLGEFLSEFKGSKLRPDAMYLLGSSLYNLGSFKEAREVFREIIKQYSSDSPLIQKCEYEIADCFYQLGDEKEAMSRFNILRSKYPDSTLAPEVIWWLGEYYYRHGDLVMAKRYFNALVRDFPSSSLVLSAYYYIGSIDEEEGRYAQALENFKRIAGQPKSDMAGNASVAIADIHAKQGQGEIAMTKYKEILSAYPYMSGLVYPRMAEFYLKAGNYPEAVLSYRQALKCVSAKEMPDIQFKIADILQSQGRNDEAIEEFMKIESLYPGSGLAVKSLLRIAVIYEGRENLSEAGKIYAKISSMDVPEAKYARERLDALAAGTGQKTKDHYR